MTDKCPRCGSVERVVEVSCAVRRHRCEGCSWTFLVEEIEPSQVADLRRQLVEAMAKLASLPVTRDGQPMLPEMMVYFPTLDCYCRVKIQCCIHRNGHRLPHKQLWSSKEAYERAIASRSTDDAKRQEEATVQPQGPTEGKGEPMEAGGQAESEEGGARAELNAGSDIDELRRQLAEANERAEGMRQGMHDALAAGEVLKDQGAATHEALRQLLSDLQVRWHHDEDADTPYPHEGLEEVEIALSALLNTDNLGSAIQAELGRLREALQPFTAIWHDIALADQDWADTDSVQVGLVFVRQAAEAAMGDAHV